MNLLENIFSWPNPTHQGYGIAHIVICILTILFSIFFLKWGKRASINTTKKVIFAFGIFFFCLELYKQLFFHVFEKRDGYKWSLFPFQFCSTPLYFCLITPLLPHQGRKFIFSFLAFYGFLGGFSVLLFPETVLSVEVTITMQSLIWHGAMVVLACYLIGACDFGQQYKEIYPGTIVFLVITAMALTMDIVFEQFKVRYQLTDTFNMFFISPYYKSNVLVLSTIWEKTNWCVFFACYVFGIMLAATVLFWSIRGISGLYQRIKDKNVERKSFQKNS
ncbi:MAG: YwaF family protein [Prevotella sp.]|nr:YwaF family protein [Staphylococcus sp.]MCM1350932.1 YwaF family protein [Prevotella sp.]